MVQQIPLNIKFKTCLKMCIQRLRYAQEKQQALAKQDRREVAQLLSNGKEQKAHYRVESLINDDIHLELLEIMELYCELLHARVNILSGIENEATLISNHMDDGINEACRSIVYTTLYIPEAKELSQVKDLLTYKFGPDFTRVIIEDQIGVPEKILKKCSPKLPSQDLVTMYMKEIARTYEVPYSQLSDDEEEEEQEKGEDGEDEDGRPIVAVDNDDEHTEDADHPITIRKPRQNSENLEKGFKIPNDIKKDVKVIRKKETNDDDLDQLKKRFAALRR
ncbi:hypothetical protein ZYGR_0K00170 [Zygosaccharomyces rouxii]|uniref:Vacuolar protein sorting-associated protein IST1 n=1 Tax=Zygosaccharomyces rouxii TaxID=4956 RepID=A0A1Q2ZYI7_ZYGRO|nr:hypothetical protein ZYGR_0K00170 [Zygosaccharomyces rouxii]